MEIREAKRGKCRKCNWLIDSRLWNEYPITYQESTKERAAIFKLREELSKTLEKEIRTSTRLFALEGHTSSGSGTEIICERHLREFADELNKYLKDLRA